MRIQIIDPSNQINIATIYVPNKALINISGCKNKELPDIVIEDRGLPGIIGPSLGLSLEDWVKDETEEAQFIAFAENLQGK